MYYRYYVLFNKYSSTFYRIWLYTRMYMHTQLCDIYHARLNDHVY